MLVGGKTALVTGANRGFGRHLAAELRDRGANVYAAARSPLAVDLPGVTPVALDVTDPSSVAAAAAATGDVAILVNNAGSATGASLLTGDLADIRTELETHFFGALAVVRAFAPQLARHGESVILNVLSVLSWLSVPRIGAYCAAKSAEWSLTNALRQELAPQGTRVSALHVGYMDTDMARHVDAPKSDPAVIAKLAVDGIEAGDTEIIADEISQRFAPGSRAVSLRSTPRWPDRTAQDGHATWRRSAAGGSPGAQRGQSAACDGLTYRAIASQPTTGKGPWSRGASGRT